ncbi:MAG: hypothetical protein K8R59_10310 [Thermoanaerobaculales bacterium]|nr:hypothetical protein [Thermoanaerobaculales bacterium]
MVAGFGIPPLVRWDGLHLVVHLPAVEELLREKLANVDVLTDPRLSGGGDVIQLTVSVRWKGVVSRVKVEVHEVRLRLRRFGFRLGRLRVLGGVPVPRRALELALRKAAPDLIQVIRGTGIVVVDLRKWIPQEVYLRVVAVQVIGRTIHFWLAPGSVTELPSRRGRFLGSGSEAEKILPPGSA